MSSIQDKVQRHRKVGRGRKATVLALAIAAVTAIVWVASPAASREQPARYGWHWDPPRHDHSLTTFASLLREHRIWLERAGLAVAQTEAIADLLDQRHSVFEELASAQAAMTDRVADALAAPVMDRTELARLQDEAKQLAADSIDESSALFVEIADHLTAEQRAELIRHWEEQ